VIVMVGKDPEVVSKPVSFVSRLQARDCRLLLTNRSERFLRTPGLARLRDQVLRSDRVCSGRLRSYWYRAVPNLGDQLSPVLLEWVAGTKPLWVTRRFAGKVLSTGSILGAVARGDIVWGSGLIHEKPLILPTNVTVLAVRGPLTGRLTHPHAPAVYGDPVLLLPRFHSPPSEKRYEVGVVPHYADYRTIQTDVDPSIALIDVRRPWQEVVSQIRSCHVVLSSSLHGLVVADAFGIPSVWVRITDRLVGGDFKFRDYYLGTGREVQAPQQWSDGIDSALRNPAPPSDFDPEPLLSAGRALATMRRG
jgi:pyruvyltransferase